MFLTKQIPDSLNLAASSGIIFAGFDLKEKEVDFTVTSVSLETVNTHLYVSMLFLETLLTRSLTPSLTLQ